MTDEWERGYAAGWSAALSAQYYGATHDELSRIRDVDEAKAFRRQQLTGPSPKRKRRQSPKQKLLKTMTDAKWKKYKRGSGKKTWVQIRAEVSRSQLYKKKARRMK